MSSSSRKIFPIQRQRTFSHSRVIRGAGPCKISGSCRQSPLNGIVVDVLNFLPHFAFGIKIAIIPTAALPESKRAVAIRLAVFHVPREIWCLASDEISCTLRYGLFD